MIFSPYIDFFIRRDHSSWTVRLAVGPRNFTRLRKRFEMTEILDDGLLRISSRRAFPTRWLACPFETPAER